MRIFRLIIGCVLGMHWSAEDRWFTYMAFKQEGLWEFQCAPVYMYDADSPRRCSNFLLGTGASGRCIQRTMVLPQYGRFKD